MKISVVLHRQRKRVFDDVLIISLDMHKIPDLNEKNFTHRTRVYSKNQLRTLRFSSSQKKNPDMNQMCSSERMKVKKKIQPKTQFGYYFLFFTFF